MRNFSCFDTSLFRSLLFQWTVSALLQAAVQI
jgi:hypothetical protein